MIGEAGALALRIAHKLVFILCGIVIGSLVAHYAMALALRLGVDLRADARIEIAVRSLGAFLGGLFLAAYEKLAIIIVTSLFGVLLILTAYPSDMLFVASLPIWIFFCFLQDLTAKRLRLLERAIPTRPSKAER